MTHTTNTGTGPEPAGENTVNGFIIVEGAAEFLDFLVAVFDGVENADARTPDYIAGDDTLIHAEVRIGTSAIMVADRKPDWPFTPALTQVYVRDAHETLRRATARGATVVTEVSPFYGGFEISRFLDPWHNLWWLFSPASPGSPDSPGSPESADSDPATAGAWSRGESSWDESTEDDTPYSAYTTLLTAMRNLAPPPSR